MIQIKVPCPWKNERYFIYCYFSLPILVQYLTLVRLVLHKQKSLGFLTMFAKGVSLSGTFHVPLLHSLIPLPREFYFYVVFLISLDSSVAGSPNTMYLSRIALITVLVTPVCSVSVTQESNFYEGQNYICFVPYYIHSTYHCYQYRKVTKNFKSFILIIVFKIAYSNIIFQNIM